MNSLWHKFKAACGWDGSGLGYQRAYEGTSQSRRMRNFQPTTDDINAILSLEGDELRARCRHLIRSNAWASNGRDSYSANAIGTGIKPQSLHPNPRMRENLHAWFREWTDYCDSANATDFYGLQRLVCDATFEAGECFVRLRPRRNADELPLPLQLQVLESEHCPITMNQPAMDTQNIIRCGIEFDRLGRRTRYHMYRQHPGSMSPRIIADDLVPVPADKVLHQYKPKRPGQVRGEPWLAPILVQLYELDAYEDAEVVRKKTCAMITHFITVSSSVDVPTIGTDEDGVDDIPITQVVPGSTVYLRDNEMVVPTQATEVGSSYGEFMNVSLHRIAAGLGITYEMMTGDLRQVSYSSIRSGQLELRRRIEQHQHQCIVYQFCRPVWQAFVEACTFAGKIDAREYRRNQKDYLSVEWRTPAWQWVDPLKDVQAQILEINNHLKSRDSAIHERGEDPEQVDREIDAGINRSSYVPQTTAPVRTPARTTVPADDEERMVQ